MSVSTYLRHLHLPNLSPYPYASAIQDGLVRAHLNWRTSRSVVASQSSPSHRPPPPTLITFQTPPTYTCGRREIGTLSPEQITHLTARGKAEFYEALRGGQTTFHGPGQLVAYLICNLKQHGLTSRCYVRLLENSVIGLLEEHAVRAHTTDNPGVWVGDAGDGVQRDDDRKIASVGVHLRRYISSHGVGINVDTDLGWFDRIVACGLPGRKATSVDFERSRLVGVSAEAKTQYDLREMGASFALQLAKRLDGEHPQVEEITEADL